MIAELHWSTTPLGSTTDWPQSLRTAVGICLASRHPMVIWWDPEYLSAHRDAAVARLTGRLARASDSDGVLSAGHLPAIVARASGGTQLLDDAPGVPLATADVTRPEAGARLVVVTLCCSTPTGWSNAADALLTTASTGPARSSPKLTILPPPRSLSGSPSNCWATVTMTTSPT
jgi:hypothetical protein